MGVSAAGAVATAVMIAEGEAKRRTRGRIVTILCDGSRQVPE